MLWTLRGDRKFGSGRSHAMPRNVTDRLYRRFYTGFMAHELMFDPEDPLLDWFRSLAMELPEAQEKISHGRPVFYTKKVFAEFSGIRKLNPSGMEQHPHAMLIKPDPLDVDVLLERDDSFFPAYVGPSGWVGLELKSLAEAEVREFLTDSYRQTAPRRLVSQLDRTD